MAQESLNLSVSGLYTATSQLNGLPPGSLAVARNIESRHKNLVESRRGFEGIPDSAIAGVDILKATNFVYNDTSRVFVLLSSGALKFYVGGGTPYTSLPGFSTGLTNPDNRNARSRLLKAAQNLYVTSADGIRSLSQETNAKVLHAGVPKGLNLEAVTNGDVSGFFDNNTTLTTLADTTSGAPTLSNLDSTAGVSVGQYVSGTNIPANTTIVSISESATVIAQNGDTTAGSTTIANLASNAGIVAGLLVSSAGVPEGARVVSIAGAGPYSVVITSPAYQTLAATPVTFATPIQITMSHNATATATASSIGFYAGAQVGYRMVFGRVESNTNGTSVTRLGSPSSIAIATNTAQTATNVIVTGTLPKNASDEISFVQLYRSFQTDSINITPLDQYNLVYERELVPGDFTARVITITDSLPDSLMGIPLYAGSDREGILQSNDPPPAAWDICTFRNMMLYAKATQPSSLSFSILSVGAPNGVQSGDTITFTYNATPYVVTAGAAENLVTHVFKVFSGGTPSQNIADTTASLIRVINYYEALQIHAISLSSSASLPGKILLETDQPSSVTFSVNASLHTAAYDPPLIALASDLNHYDNGIFVSKLGELEAAPATNLLRVGDTSSDIIRAIALRDYVIVAKTDGIYKIQGTAPSNLQVIPFDLTTNIVGPDTACVFNSAVWMLSNQGVVSISDAGVNAKSTPIDDKFNYLIGSAFESLNTYSFAVGYETQRKYIVSVPSLEGQTFTDTQYLYNYVTDTWTSWDRPLHAAFVHSQEGRLFISRDGGTGFNGLSRERNAGTYRDYADEGTDVNVVATISPLVIQLDTVAGVTKGDILYQSSTTFSIIESVDAVASTVTVLYELTYANAAAQVLKAIDCEITWNQQIADNPAFVKQFAEGMYLFKRTRFLDAISTFSTDYSFTKYSVPILGTPIGSWGLFPWGSVAWGGIGYPINVRFLVPQNSQLGSYLIPTLRITQAYSDFQLQGLSLAWSPVSLEVGK